MIKCHCHLKIYIMLFFIGKKLLMLHPKLIVVVITFLEN